MNQEHANKIITDFPKLFKNIDNLQASLMAFGFECGDGWYNLIYDTTKRIYELASAAGIIDEEWLYVVQVKEKFGGLRYYLAGGAPEYIQKVIEEAESRSYQICEYCGAEENVEIDETQYWMRSLCQVCNNKRNEDRQG